MEKQPGTIRTFSDSDGTFQFTCRMCGSCCRDDRVIVLTPQDIFILSRHFNTSTTIFLDGYCTVDREAGLNGFPLVTLRTKDGTCVFQSGNLCQLHTVRPACCRNYPVGTSFNKSRGLQHELMDPAPGCLGFEGDQEYTVDDWWQESGMKDLLPGIQLMELASQAVTRRLDAKNRDHLFSLVYDFDSLALEASGDPGDFKSLHPELLRRLNIFLDRLPPLQKP